MRWRTVKKAILIPIKDPANAKTRLATLLTPEERSRLASAMFEDVSGAVVQVNNAECIAVVTSYQHAINHAGARGWTVLEEARQTSESESVDRACEELKQRGFDFVLRLPADIPLVLGEDIDALLGVELRTPGALIVPSRDGTGTNALARTPPDLFPSRFGPDSFAIHHREATRSGAQVLVLENGRIAIDVDEPADVELVLRLPPVSRTQALLLEMKVGARLNRRNISS
ncbi:MAG TPA: 2-phospho-L-lactate guanylyltransferase [Blastocatellia bacterium]|nr:2-phospho-L-lactate guanylyltransferase [Blastocatellia bacterium]